MVVVVIDDIQSGHRNARLRPCATADNLIFNMTEHPTRYAESVGGGRSSAVYQNSTYAQHSLLCNQ